MPLHFVRKIVLAIVLCSIAPLAVAQSHRSNTPQRATQPKPPQTSSDTTQRFVGVWTAEFMETTFLRLDLKFVDGKWGGSITTGNIHTSEDGRLTDVTAVSTAKPTPIFDVALEGDTLTFKRHDDDDVDQMRMTLTGNGAADLRFLVPEGVRMQPIELTRTIER